MKNYLHFFPTVNEMLLNFSFNRLSQIVLRRQNLHNHVRKRFCDGFFFWATRAPSFHLNLHEGERIANLQTKTSCVREETLNVNVFSW